MLLFVFTDPLLLQLLLVLEHGLKGHFDHQGDRADFFRVSGDADNALAPSAGGDDHIDPGQHVGKGHARRVDHLLQAGDQPVGDLMVLADPLFVPAGDDDPPLIHDVDVEVRVAGDPLDEFCGEFLIQHLHHPLWKKYCALPVFYHKKESGRWTLRK